MSTLCGLVARRMPLAAFGLLFAGTCGSVQASTATVEEIARAAMIAPDRDFAVVSQQAIAEVVRARCGEAAQPWSEYHLHRYGW